MNKNKTQANIWVLNGPNLNMLGQRDQDIYGNIKLNDIKNRCQEACERHTFTTPTFIQSNSEGELVTAIHEACSQADGLVVNMGAHSHTSLAIRDALDIFEGPVVEVHLSNIYAREPFRHHSHISAVANGVICGLGIKGYELAIDAIIAMLSQANNDAT